MTGAEGHRKVSLASILNLTWISNTRWYHKCNHTAVKDEQVGKLNTAPVNEVYFLVR